MEAEPSAGVGASAEHRGRGIAAFVLRFDAAAGEHVLSWLYRDSGREEDLESSARRPCDLARSNRGDLLRAIAQCLAAEYGVPLREITEPSRPASSSAGHATAPDSSGDV